MKALTEYEIAVLRHCVNPDLHPDGKDWWPCAHASFVARKEEWVKRAADAAELFAAVNAGAYVLDAKGRIVAAAPPGEVDAGAVGVAAALLVYAETQADFFADPDARAEEALAAKVERYAADTVSVDAMHAVIEGYDSAKARLGAAYETRAVRETRERAEAKVRRDAKAAAIAAGTYNPGGARA